MPHSTRRSTRPGATGRAWRAPLVRTQARSRLRELRARLPRRSTASSHPRRFGRNVVADGQTPGSVHDRAVHVLTEAFPLVFSDVAVHPHERTSDRADVVRVLVEPIAGSGKRGRLVVHLQNPGPSGARLWGS